MKKLKYFLPIITALLMFILYILTKSPYNVPGPCGDTLGGIICIDFGRFGNILMIAAFPVLLFIRLILSAFKISYNPLELSLGQITIIVTALYGLVTFLFGLLWEKTKKKLTKRLN